MGAGDSGLAPQRFIWEDYHFTKMNPKDPSTKYFGFWDWGNSNYSTGFGGVHEYWVLGPLGELVSSYGAKLEAQKAEF